MNTLIISLMVPSHLYILKEGNSFSLGSSLIKARKETQGVLAAGHPNHDAMVCIRTG